MLAEALQGVLAPSCFNHWDNATTHFGRSCRDEPYDGEAQFCCDRSQDRHGLLVTMLLCGSWMGWAILCWGAGYVLLASRARRGAESPIN